MIPIPQSGFIAGDSIVNQLVDTHKTFCKALDYSEETSAIFYHISTFLIESDIKVYFTKLQTFGTIG